MVELKTKKLSGGVKEFLTGISDDEVRSDCQTLIDLMGNITGKEPDMWGTSMVGFDTYRYKYATGREGEWFLMGFSPRKQNITIYIQAGYDDKQDILARLGPHSIGKSCLYIRRLADINMQAFKELLVRAKADYDKA